MTSPKAITYKNHHHPERTERVFLGYYEGIQELRLDLVTEGADEDKSKFNNIPAATAHEIADWIKANVPEPKPTHRDWDSIPVGASFGYYRDEESALKGGRYPYTKASATSYTHEGKLRDYPAEPASDGLFVKPTEPGARAFITALEPGTRFRHQPSKLGYIRLTEDQVWSESAKASFPIADFGDVYPGADYFEVVD